MRVVLFLFILVLLSCRKEPKTYPLPDFTPLIEAEFPYKELQKPLRFYSGTLFDSVIFVVSSKTVSRHKNTAREPEAGLSGLSSYGSAVLEAPQFTYGVNAIYYGNQLVFEHSFRLYKFSTNVAVSPLRVSNMMAGSVSVNITNQSDSLRFFGKTYYDVIRLDTYSSAVLNGDVEVSRVLFCRSHGVIGFYDEKKGRWYYLRPNE